MARRTPTKSPQTRAAAAATTTTTVAVDNDVEDFDADGGLLRGHKFYLSRAIAPARRSELRALIQSNGGVAMQRTAPNSVELVESDQLQVGKPWVSVDFVYDSVRDQVLQDVSQYMAATLQSVAQLRSEQIDGQPKRRGKQAYTAEDDAKMLLFLEAEENARQRKELSRRNGRQASGPPTDQTASTSATTPERTTSPGETTTDEPLAPPQGFSANASLIPRKAVPLVKPAPVVDGESTDEEIIQGRGKERGRKSAAEEKTVLEAAADLSSAADAGDVQSAAKSAPPTTQLSTTASPPPPQEDQATQLVTGTFSTPIKETPVALKAASSSSEKQQKEDTTRETVGAQEGQVREKGTDDDTTSATKTETQPRDRNSPAASSSSERRIGGIFFRSRWDELINATAKRQQLEKYFTLNRQQVAPSSTIQKSRRPEKPSVSASTKEPTSSNATTTPRSRKRQVEVAAAEEEESKEEQQVEKEAQPAKAAVQKKRRAHRSEQQQQEAVVSAATTVEASQPDIVDVTSDTEMDELICRIQFETSQDLASVTHALYYCSGDVEVTTTFLNGASSADVWSPDDDLLLVDLMQPTIDASKVAEAQRRGAFSRMRVARSAAQILTRIQYLL